MNLIERMEDGVIRAADTIIATRTTWPNDDAMLKQCESLAVSAQGTCMMIATMRDNP